VLPQAIAIREALDKALRKPSLATVFSLAVMMKIRIKMKWRIGVRVRCDGS
jgi:hypothetical protein